jgi:SAM-dependent methyltransferase
MSGARAGVPSDPGARLARRGASARGGWRARRLRMPGRREFWRFNWLAHHKRIHALERVRDHVRGDLLDVGCGARPFEPLLRGRVRRYFGADVPHSTELSGAGPDVFAPAEALPFRDGSFDTLLAMALMPYLPVPDLMLREARRVLRPGGIAIIEFQMMGPPWNPPRDYFRFTRYGAELLLLRNGFEPLVAIPVGGLMARVGLWALAGLNRINRGPLRVLTEIPVRLLYALLQLTFEGLDQVFFDPSDVLGHLVVARRI